ncbi:MAG: hypothetical protein KGL11_06000 [Alphaproteobacteria bacterium]|nr:hypothetical protein [Alphaproteobacteria bacterium]
MNEVLPFPMPPRVPPVEPDLLASAVFVFGEYLDRLRAAMPPPEENADAGGDAPAPAEPEIDTRAVLDLFAEELGTSVPVTLALFLRVTALFRLLAQSPSLARVALETESASDLSETALLAAARLDLPVKREGPEGAADFDPRAFRAALTRA